MKGRKWREQTCCVERRDLPESGTNDTGPIMPRASAQYSKKNSGSESPVTDKIHHPTRLVVGVTLSISRKR